MAERCLVSRSFLSYAAHACRSSSKSSPEMLSMVWAVREVYAVNAYPACRLVCRSSVLRL